jgi:putative redox protein
MSSLHVRWLGDYRTEMDIRGVHRLQGDETPQYGGQDTGPMPGELLLAAVGSCMCLAVAHLAKKRRIALGTLTLEATAKKDENAFRIKSIHLTIQADLPQDKLEPLVERARGYCFISNTLAKSCPVLVAAESIPARQT